MGILSGRYQQRSGVYDNYRRDISGCHLWVKQKTIADYLRQAGYRTGLVGKWHAVDVKEPWGAQSIEKGFDEFVGIPGGMSADPPAAGLYRGHEPFRAPLEAMDEDLDALDIVPTALAAAGGSC